MNGQLGLKNIPLSHSFLLRMLLKSRRIGPFVRQSFHRVPGNYDMLHAVTASVKDVSQVKEVLAAGGGLTRDRAFFAAIGEALERLSLRQPQHLEFVLKTFDCPENEIDPNLFLSGISIQEVPITPWRKDMPIFWRKGINLKTNRLHLIPAFALFPDGGAHTPDCALLYANTSTGTATSRSKTSAVISGIYEVIERDAFVTHWENRWSGVPVALGRKTQALLEVIESRGFKVSVVALGTDTGVPVALASVEDQTGYQSSISFGAAARANWDDASYRALEEALLTSFWISTRIYIEGKSYEEAREALSGLPEPSDHALLYGFDQAKECCLFLFDASTSHGVSFVSPPEKLVDEEAELEWLLGRMSAVGASCFCVDITHPSAMALGLHVSRVVVPGFIPLSRGKVRSILNPRLLSTANALGRSHRKRYGFNPDPHPFP